MNFPQAFEELSHIWISKGFAQKANIFFVYQELKTRTTDAQKRVKSHRWQEKQWHTKTETIAKGTEEEVATARADVALPLLVGASVSSMNQLEGRLWAGVLSSSQDSWVGCLIPAGWIKSLSSITHLGNLDWLPSSWNWPDPVLEFERWTRGRLFSFRLSLCICIWKRASEQERIKRPNTTLSLWNLL